MNFSSTKWTQIHRVSVNLESDQEGWLQFGAEAPTFAPLRNASQTIISRGISTVTLHPNFPIMFNSDSLPAATESLKAATVESSAVVTANTNEVPRDPPMENLDTPPSFDERDALNYIKSNEVFINIYELVSELLILYVVTLDCQSMNAASKWLH